MMTSFEVIRPQDLGAASFSERYGLEFAYLSGAMYKGIATKELVVAMGKIGMLGFYGTGGVRLSEIEEVIEYVKANLDSGQAYGMNLLNNMTHPEVEEQTVDLFLKHNVPVIEASAYVSVSSAVIRYRLNNIHRGTDGSLIVPHRVIAKVSRPDVAESFMSCADERIVRRLYEAGKITAEEAELASQISVADDICVEADSGGHTDCGRILTLLPSIISVRDRLMNKHRYERKIHIGAAGGIGTPTAAAAAFVLGADFITTGSINQCTVEAGISDSVKDMLQQIDVQDTDYAPAGDMFEIGAKVQVLKKGVLFPSRAKKLYELYCHNQSLDDIDAKTRNQIETKYFKRSFDEVWEETRHYYEKSAPEILAKAERSGKVKMALVFRWYFIHSTRLALNGDPNHKVDFQVHCGPALGAFNQWVRGTELEDWHNRSTAKIGLYIMQGAADYLTGNEDCN